jgi:hypothetical protein
MAQTPEFESLIGSWRLLSVTVTMSDTKERVEPYGPNPDGYMVLSASGRVMFLFTNPNRPLPQTDQDRTALFDSMTAYTGCIRLDAPGRIVTQVDLAWNPGFRGEQVRFFSLEGDRLTIRTPEQTHPQYRDRLVMADLVWVRESVSAGIS